MKASTIIGFFCILAFSYLLTCESLAEPLMTNLRRQRRHHHPDHHGDGNGSDCCCDDDKDDDCFNSSTAQIPCDWCADEDDNSTDVDIDNDGCYSQVDPCCRVDNGNSTTTTVRSA
ncbi:UNVERIFIED_CONTAM: hypothetical protein RMT77_002747 [Armadillidium vulgare]